MITPQNPDFNLDMTFSDYPEVPFLCAGLRLGQPEAALGGLLDILGMCPSMGTGLCGLVVLDIWMPGKESRGEQAKYYRLRISNML